jgi:hypothetical protein
VSSNIAILLFSLTTFQFSFALYRAMEDIPSGSSFERAVLSLILAAVAWAFGAVVAYLIPAARELHTNRGRRVRWVAVLSLALSSCAWPWVQGMEAEAALAFVAFFSSGVLIPSILALGAGSASETRAAYVQLLIGAAMGTALGAALYGVRGTGILFVAASVATLLAPIWEPGLFYASRETMKRWFMVLPLFGMLALLVGTPATKRVESGDASRSTPADHLASAGAPYLLKASKDELRKMDVFVIGARTPAQVKEVVATGAEAGARSITVAADALSPVDIAELKE